MTLNSTLYLKKHKGWVPSQGFVIGCILPCTLKHTNSRRSHKPVSTCTDFRKWLTHSTTKPIFMIPLFVCVVTAVLEQGLICLYSNLQALSIKAQLKFYSNGRKTALYVLMILRQEPCLSVESLNQRAVMQKWVNVTWCLHLTFTWCLHLSVVVNARGVSLSAQWRWPKSMHNKTKTVLCGENGDYTTKQNWNFFNHLFKHSIWHQHWTWSMPNLIIHISPQSAFYSFVFKYIIAQYGAYNCTPKMFRICK